MHAYQITHYRRPDTSNVTWLTPQQMDEKRLELSLRAPVNVLEEKRAAARRKKLTAEFSEELPATDVNVTQLQADAPRVAQIALQNGWVKIVPPVVVQAEHRSRTRAARAKQRAHWTPARRRKMSAFMKGYWKEQHQLNS